MIILSFIIIFYKKIIKDKRLQIDIASQSGKKSIAIQGDSVRVYEIQDQHSC